MNVAYFSEDDEYQKCFPDCMSDLVTERFGNKVSLVTLLSPKVEGAIFLLHGNSDISR